MVESKNGLALVPPKKGGELTVHGSDERPQAWLIVLHTPSGEGRGSRIAVAGSSFTIGTREQDLAITGALESGTAAELVWGTGDAAETHAGWSVKGVGRLWVNGEATQARQLVAVVARRAAVRCSQRTTAGTWWRRRSWGTQPCTRVVGVASRSACTRGGSIDTGTHIRRCHFNRQHERHGEGRARGQPRKLGGAWLRSTPWLDTCSRPWTRRRRGVPCRT